MEKVINIVPRIIRVFIVRFLWLLLLGGRVRITHGAAYKANGRPKAVLGTNTTQEDERSMIFYHLSSRRPQSAVSNIRGGSDALPYLAAPMQLALMCIPP